MIIIDFGINIVFNGERVLISWWDDYTLKSLSIYDLVIRYVL